jgi:2-dehydropantoate 2-reductase
VGEQITIVGAGAIGGVLGAYMSAAGHDVLLVDSVAEHVAAINQNGLRISGFRGDRTYKVKAVTPDQLTGPLGFVILAVKAQHTLQALAPLEPLLAPDGFVVSLQNGLCEEIIAGRVGKERTVGAFVHFGADYQEPGHILLASEIPIRVGELDGRLTPRLGRIAGALAAVMPTALTSNVWGYLWGKMCYGTMAFGGALVDRPFGEVCAHPEHQALMIAIARETARIAQAQSIHLEAIPGLDPNLFLLEDPEPARQLLTAMGAAGKGNLKQYTGIQRDLMVRKRKTEVDYQPGAVAAKARGLGLQAPYAEQIITMIHEVEEGKRPLGWENLKELADRVAAIS